MRYPSDSTEPCEQIGDLQRAREWIMSQSVTDYRISKSLAFVLDLIQEKEIILTELAK